MAAPAGAAPARAGWPLGIHAARDCTLRDGRAAGHGGQARPPGAAGGRPGTVTRDRGRAARLGRRHAGSAAARARAGRDAAHASRSPDGPGGCRIPCADLRPPHRGDRRPGRHRQDVHHRRCRPGMADMGRHGDRADALAGGALRMLAGSDGYAQLAEPVRFTQAWEREASLRLRHGDKTALEAYDQHGRITGGTREVALKDLRGAYVASRLAGEEMLIMAWRQQDCRELSRIIRADLIHLGLVDGGRSVTIAEGARASAGDLIAAKKNDPRMETDPGHTRANHDIFRVEAVTERGLMVRRVIDGKDRVRLADRPGLYPLSQFATTELSYAVTAHKGQGGTYEAGEPLVTGTESREWLYTAMTRGWRRNAAHAVTQPARADP